MRSLVRFLFTRFYDQRFNFNALNALYRYLFSGLLASHLSFKTKSIYRSQLQTQNQNGFTLIEVIISAGIFTISVLAIATMTQMQLTFQHDQKIKSGALEAKTNLIYTLMSPREWSNVISKSSATVNPALQCMKKVTTPCVISEAGYTLTLVDLNGNVLYDPSDATSGFSDVGGPCKGFDAANGNNSCPYRYEVTWKPVCNADTSDTTKCEINGQFPEVEIQATFKVKFKDATLFKGRSDSFNFAMTPPPTHIDGPIAHSDIVLTNTGDAVSFNLVSNDTSDSGTDLSIKSLSGASKGGTLTKVDSKTVRYTPPAGFTGMDSFKYTVEDELGNVNVATAYVKVMTPYTWTGEGSDQNWSTVQNWCGVVDLDAQKCLHNQSMTDIANMAMLFDETCTDHCEAHIDQTMSVASVYVADGFMGLLVHDNSATLNVGQDTALLAKNYFDDRTMPVFSGTFHCGDAYVDVFPGYSEICNSSGWLTGGSAGTPKAVKKKGSFVMAGGEYKGQSGVLNIVGSLLVHAGVFTASSGSTYVASHFYQNGNSFKHGNGKVVLGKTLAGNRFNLKYYPDLSSGSIGVCPENELCGNIKPIHLRGYDTSFYNLEIAADGPVLVGLTSQIDDSTASIWPFFYGTSAPSFPWRRYDLDGASGQFYPAETKINVLGSLILDGTDYCGLKAGAIVVSQNVIANGSGCGFAYRGWSANESSLAQIVLSGGATSSVQSVGTKGHIPNLIVNKSAGTSVVLDDVHVVGSYRWISGDVSMTLRKTLTIARGVDLSDVYDLTRAIFGGPTTDQWPINGVSPWNGWIKTAFGASNRYESVVLTNYFGTSALKKVGVTEALFSTDLLTKNFAVDIDDSSILVPGFWFAIKNSQSTTRMGLLSKAGTNLKINIEGNLNVKAHVFSEDSNSVATNPRVIFNFVGAADSWAIFTAPWDGFFGVYNPYVQGSMVHIDKTGGAVIFSGEPVLVDYELIRGSVDFVSNATTVHWVGTSYPYDGYSSWYSPAAYGRGSHFKFPDSNPVGQNCFNNLNIEYNSQFSYGGKLLVGPVCVKGDLTFANTLKNTGVSGNGVAGCSASGPTNLYCGIQLTNEYNVFGGAGLGAIPDTSELILYRNLVVSGDMVWAVIRKLRWLGSFDSRITVINGGFGVGSSSPNWTGNAGDGSFEVNKLGLLAITAPVAGIRDLRILAGEVRLNGNSLTLNASTPQTGWLGNPYNNRIYDTTFGTGISDLTHVLVGASAKLTLRGATLDAGNIAVQPGGKISLGGGSVVQTATYVVGGSGTAPRRTSPAPLTSSEIIP